MTQSWNSLTNSVDGPDLGPDCFRKCLYPVYVFLRSGELRYLWGHELNWSVAAHHGLIDSDGFLFIGYRIHALRAFQSGPRFLAFQRAAIRSSDDGALGAIDSRGLLGRFKLFKRFACAWSPQIDFARPTSRLLLCSAEFAVSVTRHHPQNACVAIRPGQSSNSRSSNRIAM